MIGRRVLPCGHHRVRVPEEPGEYVRKCPTCKKDHLAEVSGSVYWSRRMGKPTFVLHWAEVEEAREVEAGDV